MVEGGRTQKITYFSKTPIGCPICGKKFYKEELMSGGGRLVAGELTDELRRLYEPTQKFGALFPLVYVIAVCPDCYYSTYPQDFSKVPEESRTALENETDKRRNSISTILGELNFEEPRGLKEGAGSYILATMTYEHFPSEFLPTFKQGLSALRGAWLFNDLHSHFPSENYDYLAKLLYRKAQFFYRLAYERDVSGKEVLSDFGAFGPDLDKNFGYDGFLYMMCLLRYKYGQKKNRELRIEALEESKKILSKVFGIGKSSKSKPSVILEKAKLLFEKLTEELKTLKEEQ